MFTVNIHGIAKESDMAESQKELEVRQYERLVRMIEQKEVRQRTAHADTLLQLQGARNALDAAKKAK